MTAPLEFQAKWDYVESHGLQTVTPRPGYVVTLEDKRTGQHWSGDSLQGAIESHTTARLEALRAALRAEDISYGELSELQGLAPFIAPGDVELLEAAGVPEHDTEDTPAA